MQQEGEPLLTLKARPIVRCVSDGIACNLIMNTNFCARRLVARFRSQPLC